MYVLIYSRGGNSCDSSDTCFIVRENSDQHAFLFKTRKERIKNGSKTAFYGPFVSQEAAEEYGVTLSKLAHPMWDFRPDGNRNCAPHIERLRPSENYYVVLIYHPLFGG